MRTNLSKKLLAAVLSLAMVLSLVGIQPSNANAASYKITKKAEMKAGKTVTYKVSGVKKTQYIKVTKKNANVTVKYNNKKVSTSKKIAGTGKALSLKVTAKEVNKDYTNKMTVKVYNKKNNKVVKTLTVSTKVLTQYVEEEPTPEEPTPEEPTVEEATLVSLEATHVKELTATLSKEVAGLTAKDFTVKKGNVKVTPASVTVEGTKVVITLGARITEGTYSVTYKESTVEVATTDEKLTSLKVVGKELAQLAWGADTNGGLAGTQNNAIDGVEVTKGSNNEVNGRIEFQALNQYGDPMNAEIANVVCSLGGEAHKQDPTVKKNGVIEIYNIAAALGIVGTSAKIIIVSKDGVSTTNEVVFSEESKVAKMELAGIYNADTQKFVDVIPATKAVSSFKLMFKAYDQYTYDLTNTNGLAKINGQSISTAQVLTNLKVADTDGAGKIAGATIETVEDVDYICLDLVSSDSDLTAKAGSLQIIIVGDRFGTVYNDTIKVSQVDLLKSFTMNAPDRIYNNDENTIEFEAVDVNGNKVTNYKQLKKLVSFGDLKDQLYFDKNTDGSASLIYKPALDEDTTYTSTGNKQSTVKSVTVSCNSEYSAADVLVTTKTFTVYQAKVPSNIVKYTGSLGTESATIFLYKNKFVFEDQYGNTLTKADSCYDDIDLVYFYGAPNSTGYVKHKDANNTSATLGTDAFHAKFADYNSATEAYGEEITYTEGHKFWAVLATGDYFVCNKQYVGAGWDQQLDHAKAVGSSTSGSSKTLTPAANDEFDLSKADVTYSFKKVDSYRAVNLTATWHDASYMATTQLVGYNDEHSGVTASNFTVKGTVNGVSVRIPSNRVTIKSDSYKKIGYDERNTAVKTANVVLTVLLKDENGDEFTEEIESSYQYSAAPSQYAGIISMSDYLDTDRVMNYDDLTNANLSDEFFVYDQYGYDYDVNKTLEVSLGTDTDYLVVKSNNTKNAKVSYTGEAVFYDGKGSITVVCTTANGDKTSEKIAVKYGATEETDADQIKANKDALQLLTKYVGNNVTKTYKLNSTDDSSITLANASTWDITTASTTLKPQGTPAVALDSLVNNTSETVIITVTNSGKTVALKIKFTKVNGVIKGELVSAADEADAAYEAAKVTLATFAKNGANEAALVDDSISASADFATDWATVKGNVDTTITGVDPSIIVSYKNVKFFDNNGIELNGASTTAANYYITYTVVLSLAGYEVEYSVKSTLQ